MTLQIGSREHIKEVLNSGELISADIGFLASVLFKGPETKGGKRSGYIPGEKIWEKLAKELRCVCDIKNKDELCCARVIVVMREYPKREKGASNSLRIYEKTGVRISSKSKKLGNFTEKPMYQKVRTVPKN